MGEALFLFFDLKSQCQLPKRCSRTRMLPSFLQRVLLNKERVWHRALHKVYGSREKLNRIPSPEAWRLSVDRTKPVVSLHPQEVTLVSLTLYGTSESREATAPVLEKFPWPLLLLHPETVWRFPLTVNLAHFSVPMKAPHTAV